MNDIDKRFNDLIISIMNLDNSLNYHNLKSQLD